MKKSGAYLVTLFDRKRKWTHRIIFNHPPTYKETIQKLPNEFRTLLASGSNMVKFEFSLCNDPGFSTPLFSTNPSEAEYYDKSISNLQTLIGRITVEKLVMYK